MDAIRLHSDGTLSSEAPFAGLLRMRLELDGDVTLRSFFRLLKRNPLARELVPGLGDALAEAEACPASGCRYPGLEALRLGKRVELTGFPGTPRVDVYLAVEGVGDELPELRFSACGTCWTPRCKRGRPGMSCSARQRPRWTRKPALQCLICWKAWAGNSGSKAAHSPVISRSSEMLFKNILFASSGTAGSDNAAKLAFGLAEKQQAELTLYHCCGVPSRGFTTNVTDTRSGSLEQPDEAYQEMVREELNTAYAYQIEACTRPFRMELSVGMPSTEILRYARQIKPDLIVMGASSAASDPNAARMRSIVGNTVRAVAKKAPCPVLIVNRPCTTCWHLFSNIVFCTDFSEAANHAFRFALNTARQLNAKLYITHAVDITSIQGMTMDQSEIERHAEQMREKIDKLYLSKLDGFANAEVIVREGIPYVEILKVARENEADLIVMAHHSSDLSDDDADIGSTVEQVVLRSACPVASVTRPEAR